MKRIVSVIMAGLCLGGCVWIDGGGNTARFEYTGTGDSCVSEQFPQEFTQFETDAPYDGVARMRLYESVARRLTLNHMAINFEDIDRDTLQPCPPVEDLVGQSVDLTVNGCVRALYVVNGCEPTKTLRIIGQLTLDNYSTARGKRVSGSLNGKLQEVRKVSNSLDEIQEIVTDYGELSGEFSYVNHAAPVWRN